MKIYARGHYRSRGSRLIAEAPLEENTRPDSLYVRLLKTNWPHWDETKQELVVRIKGKEGPTTHKYEVFFTVEDLAFMLLAALQHGSKDEAVGIRARAMVDKIRAALSSKGGRKQRIRAKKKRKFTQ